MIFVIGNGKSRKDVDLEKLKSRGITIGCNALYRFFNPNILVTADPVIINEIIISNYATQNDVYYVEDQNITYIPKDQKIYKVPWSDNLYPINSGFSAVRLAHHFYPKEQIYMLGFDIFGDRNNLYDGTHGYPEIGEKHHMENEWIGMFTLLKSHFCPDIKLKRVINDQTKIETIDNITYENFYKEIKL